MGGGSPRVESTCLRINVVASELGANPSSLQKMGMLNPPEIARKVGIMSRLNRRVHKKARTKPQNWMRGRLRSKLRKQILLASQTLCPLTKPIVKNPFVSPLRCILL